MAERGSQRTDMAESPVCTICFEAVQNGRLLDCLHTFCKGCLDDLDMRTGHMRKITCPVCRSTINLPENGASGLPRDITVEVATAAECATCKAEDRKGEPELSCASCNLAFCKEDAVTHVMANSGHSVIALSKDDSSLSFRPTANSSYARQCREHGLPVRCYCKQCNIAVCGECIAFGRHYGHQPIVAVKDIVKDLRERVRQKMDQLKNKRLPNAQRALSAVKDVSTELSSRAEKVRTSIRSSAQRVHETIELVMQQKLAQVDDLEELRLKHLSEQQDELKRYTDSLKSVVHFSEKLMEKDAEAEDVCDLLSAVDKRADEVDKVHVVEKPVEHACVDYENISEETLFEKANKFVGVVLPCQASAEHSYIEDALEKYCLADSSVSFVVVAKDYNGSRLSTGGDVIRVESRQTSADSNFGCIQPRFDVYDNSNGTYSITIAAEQAGNYSFDVFINDVKLEQSLSVSCCSFTFDPAECQTGNTLSEDKLTVTHSGDTRFRSVLCSEGMQNGQFVWKVNVTKSENMHVFLGVAEKPLTARSYNYSSTYSWYGYDGKKWILGTASQSMTKWQENDVLQLQLDCTKHAFTITNLRSGETDTISNLPSTELFAYVATHNTGDSMKLV